MPEKSDREKKKTLSEKSDEVRRDTLQALSQAIEEFGISPRDIDSLTGLNYRMIYRWIGSQGSMLPSFEDVGVIIEFCKKVDEIRDYWTAYLKFWNDVKIPPEIPWTFISKKYRAPLDEDDNIESNVRGLTKITIKDLAFFAKRGKK